MATSITTEDRTQRFEPTPVPWRNAALRAALVNVLASATMNPDPDDPEEAHGPGGPRIRQQMAALALMQLGTLISDHAARGTIHSAATSVLTAHAGH